LAEVDDQNAFENLPEEKQENRSLHYLIRQKSSFKKEIKQCVDYDDFDESFFAGRQQHQPTPLPIASVIGHVEQSIVTTFTSPPHVFRSEPIDPNGSCFFLTSASGMKYAGMLPNVTTYDELNEVARILRRRLAGYLRTHKEQVAVFFAFENEESDDYKHYRSFDNMCDKLEVELSTAMSEFVPDAAVAIFTLVTGIAISVFKPNVAPVYANAVKMETYLPNKVKEIGENLPINHFTSFLPGAVSVETPHINMHLSNLHYVPLIDIFRIRMYFVFARDLYIND
jgi:hypothetical protein